MGIYIDTEILYGEDAATGGQGEAVNLQQNDVHCLTLTLGVLVLQFVSFITWVGNNNHDQHHYQTIRVLGEASGAICPRCGTREEVILMQLIFWCKVCPGVLCMSRNDLGVAEKIMEGECYRATVMVSLLECRGYVGQADDRHMIAGFPLVICEPLSTSPHQIAVQLSLFFRNTAQVLAMRIDQKIRVQACEMFVIT